MKLKNILSENISFRESKDNNNYFWYNECDTVQKCMLIREKLLKTIKEEPMTIVLGVGGAQLRVILGNSILDDTNMI